MFLAVEPFLLQDDRRHAVVEQRQARVMGPGYDPENEHSDCLDANFNNYNNGP